MADYGLLGALAGLGEGLSMYGQNMYKSQLAEKLEAQRAEQEDKRAQAKEDRAERRLRARPDPTQTTFIERDGALFRQTKNAYGELIDETLASADDIDKRNYTKAKQKNELALSEMNLEGKSLLNRINAAKAEDADALSDLELDVKRSTINRNNQQGLAAIIRANKTGSGSSNAAEPASMNEYATLLKKEAKDVIDQFQAEDETLTATEINKITRQAVEEAAKYNIDPQNLLEQMLRERSRNKALMSDDSDDEDE